MLSWAVHSLIFTVRLSRMAGEPVTVNYDTRDVTATDGEDYSGGRGTLRFGPCELEKQGAVAGP